MTFGDKIRELRLSKRLSLRDLAQLVDMDFTYLSKIENNKVAPPTAEIITQMASHLDEDPDVLLALAFRFSPEGFREAVEKNPQIGILFRKLQSRQLNTDQLKRIVIIASEDGSDTDADTDSSSLPN